MLSKRLKFQELEVIFKTRCAFPPQLAIAIITVSKSLLAKIRRCLFPPTSAMTNVHSMSGAPRTFHNHIGRISMPPTRLIKQTPDTWPAAKNQP